MAVDFNSPVTVDTGTPASPRLTTYVHTVRYFSKGIDQQGPYYDVEYQIDDWTLGDAFANSLLGLGRTNPHRHPLSINLACVSAVVEGRGRPSLSPSGLPAYLDGAFVRATYRAPLILGLPTASDDPGWVNQIDASTPILWCTQEMDYEIETITHPNTTNYKFESDSLKLAIPFQLDMHVTILNLTFHRLPYLPMGVVRTLRGRINRGTFLGAADECVLFRGARTQRDYNTDGSINQRVQMTFVERDVSWNKFLRPDKIDWDYVTDGTTTAGSPTRRYTKADLSPLVRI